MNRQQHCQCFLGVLWKYGLIPKRWLTNPALSIKTSQFTRLSKISFQENLFQLLYMSTYQLGMANRKPIGSGPDLLWEGSYLAQTRCPAGHTVRLKLQLESVPIDVSLSQTDMSVLVFAFCTHTGLFSSVKGNTNDNENNNNYLWEATRLRKI